MDEFERESLYVSNSYVYSCCILLQSSYYSKGELVKKGKYDYRHCNKTLFSKVSKLLNRVKEISLKELQDEREIRLCICLVPENK